MKKKFPLIILCAVLLAACESDEILENDIPANDDRVRVEFGLTSEGIQTGSDIEPMVRADDDEIKTVINPNCNVVIMKKMSEELWVVDTVFTHKIIDLGYSVLSGYPVAGNPEFTPFSLTLRPGQYKALVVINSRGARFNNNIKPLMHIPVNDVPMAVTYANVTVGNSQGGEINAGLEVFVGVKDFEVEKQQELNTPGVSTPVEIHTTRRTTKFELWAKYVENAEKNFTHYLGYQCGYSMYALGGDEFCAGVDLFGEPYYNSLTDMNVVTWSKPTNTSGGYYFETSDGTEKYAMSHLGTTVYSVYFFTDPERDVRFKIGNIRYTFQMGSEEYHGMETTERVLKHGANDAVGLIPDGFDTGSTYFEIRYFKFERDLEGNVPNVSGKMSPYKHWNFPFLNF